MKTFEEIDPHLQIIRDIDQRKDSGALDRRRAISGLVYRLADELIAGHPAPRSDDPGYFTRIDGLVPALANELVRQHDMAIAHRTHLAERLEADGGENGAKAAAILRGMNALAQPVFFTNARLTDFDREKLAMAPLEPGSVFGLPEYAFPASDASIPMTFAPAGRDADLKEAELRGFYLGRNKALGILFAERRKWGLGDSGDVRGVLAEVSEAIVYMQKEG